MLHDQPSNKTARHTPNDRRNERHPRLRRALMLHRLHIHSHMEDDRHTARHTEKVAQVAGQQGRIRYDPFWCERLGGESELYDAEDDEENGKRGKGDDGSAVCPGDIPAVVEADKEGGDTEDKGEGATKINALELVKPVRVVTGRKLKSEGDRNYG